MGQAHLANIRQHSGVDLVLWPDGDVDQGQRRADGHSKRSRVVPLIGPKVQVQNHFCPRFTGQLSRKERGAAAGFSAWIGPGKLEDTAFGDGSSQDVVDAQLYIGGVFPVVNHGEFVGRLNTQHRGAGAIAWCTGDKPGFDAFLFQEIENEIAHRILAENGPQPASSYTNVGRRAPHMGGKRLYINKWRADLIAVEINGGSPNVKGIISTLCFGHCVPPQSSRLTLILLEPMLIYRHRRTSPVPGDALLKGDFAQLPHPLAGNVI